MGKVARPAIGGTIGLLREIVTDFMEIATEVVRVVIRAVQGNWLVVHMIQLFLSPAVGKFVDKVARGVGKFFKRIFGW